MALILGETFILSDVVRPLGASLHPGDVPFRVAKVGLTVVLGVLRVVVMFGMWRLRLKARQTPT